MRATHIYLAGYAPFENREPLQLNTNDERVLFLGISGSGKSTLFRVARLLWSQVERYLNGQPPCCFDPGQLALVFEGLPFGTGIIARGDEDFGDWLKKKHPGARLLLAQGERFLGDWPLESLRYPNLVAAEDPVDWISLLPGCPQAIEAANQLLVGKVLEIIDGCLQVRIPNNNLHAPEHLSMGEKRICLMCALAGAVLKPGGLLLLDEPDVHLHPSQSLGLMTTLENLVLDKDGQMWVISHKESLWQRYEDVGLVVTLSREVPHA